MSGARRERRKKRVRVGPNGKRKGKKTKQQRKVERGKKKEGQIEEGRCVCGGVAELEESASAAPRLADCALPGRLDWNARLVA